jgi:hypothetical protein
MQPDHESQPEEIVAEEMVAEGFATWERQLALVAASIAQASAQLEPILEKMRDIRTARESILEIRKERSERRSSHSERSTR